MQPATSINNTTDEWPTLARVIETATFQSGYNTNLVILGTSLLGLAAGIIGVFALLRKRSLVADALSHATLPGIALAFLIAAPLGFEPRSIPVLLIGAAATSILGIVCIQAILRHSRLKEDAAIGIVLSVFFGAGIVGLSYIQNNAAEGSAGLNKFIYGQAAAMQPADVYLMAGIAIAAVIATIFFLKEFAIVCFNPSFAKVDGWPVSTIDLVMMALVVTVTVAGLQAVGIILVVAMLIIPPVAARFWTERLWLLVTIAALIGAASGYLGSVTSALLPRKPAGAVIVLTAGALFTISLFAAPARGVIASALRRLRLRIKIAGDHLLENAHRAQTSTIEPNTLDTLAKRWGWSSPFRALVTLNLRRTRMLKNATNNALSITTAGQARGARVARNHALWEQYLITHADIAPSHVDWSVDQVEHILDDKLIARLEQKLRDQNTPIPPRAQEGNAANADGVTA